MTKVLSLLLFSLSLTPPLPTPQHTHAHTSLQSPCHPARLGVWRSPYVSHRWTFNCLRPSVLQQRHNSSQWQQPFNSHYYRGKYYYEPHIAYCRWRNQMNQKSKTFIELSAISHHLLNNLAKRKALFPPVSATWRLVIFDKTPITCLLNKRPKYPMIVKVIAHSRDKTELSAHQSVNGPN